MNLGKVYLVGAGVGAVSYLTLKAKELLSQAEVLVYDALVDNQLLNLVPETCLKIDVGKRGGKNSTPQTQINQILVKYCLEGKQIIRLKSGDPLIFGRAREEIKALQQAGCQWQIIPGISSALAAPLLAGIPLTDKIFSRCFAVLSGHQPENLDWSALAKIDTLVILMGGSTLPIIIEELQKHGRSANFPIAIIKNCADAHQQIWYGTLGDIIEKTSGISLSPSVIIIGKVVELKHIFQPETTTNLPLNGKTILVTRAAEQSSNFSQLLQQQGANVIEMPALEITPPSSWQELDQAIAKISSFNWLILTSANAVEYFFKRLETLGKDARSLAQIKIAVVGKKTAVILKQKGLNADFIPPNFVADSLVETFPESLIKQKILFPRVETGGREILVKELSSQGAEVVEVAAYESGCPQQIEPQVWQALQQKQVDIITFASSKTVANFVKLVKQINDDDLSILNYICLASIGPQTSKTCIELLGRVDVEAKEYTLEGLTEAIKLLSI